MDVVDEDTSILEAAAAAAGHDGKRERLMQPGEILRDMAYHFADSPCCQHAIDSCRNDEDWIWDDADDDNERYAPDTRVQSAASCSYSYQYQCVPMCNVCVCICV